MNLLAVAFVFTALALAVYTVLTATQERQTVRESLKQLAGYDVANERDRELEAPLAERVAEPMMALAKAISAKVWPPEYVASTKAKLLVAGVSNPQAVDRFLAIRIVGIAAAPAVFLLLFLTGFLTSTLNWVMLGLLILILVMGPQAWLDRTKGERQELIRRALPDILDLLTISVEAGLGFEQALDRVVASVPGPLSEEFGRMLGETRAGLSRADAMRALDERTDVAEVRSFVLAILQADTFGVSIGRILRGQADEMRIKRRQMAQERAQKAPVKMLVPMVFCVFPALFVVVLGPAVLNIRESF